MSRTCHNCNADVSECGHMIPKPYGFGFFYICGDRACRSAVIQECLAYCQEERTERLLNGTSVEKPVGIMQDLKFTIQLELAFDYDMAPETDNEQT